MLRILAVSLLHINKLIVFSDVKCVCGQNLRLRKKIDNTNILTYIFAVRIIIEVGNMLSTVTTKGQVTIPKAIRDIMNIQTNDRVSFTREDDRIILQPVKTLKSFRGAVKASGSAGPFSTERAKAKDSVAKRVQEESK